MIRRNLWLAVTLWCLVLPLRAAHPALLARTVKATASAGGCTVTTNAITINLLTSFGDTSNNSFYASASVTPSAAGATLLAFVANSPVVSTYTVTNTGTTQLSWWYAGITFTNRYAATNYNTLASPANRLAVWVSQLPPGVSPFAMRVVPQGITSGSGACVAIAEVLGASTNQLWGQDAIRQVAARASNATVFPRIDWGAPGNSGSNTIIYALADDINSATNRLPETGWTPLATNTYNTPATSLAVFYKNYVPAATTFTTNAIASRDWASIAIEINAGTNACGYEDPLIIPPNSTTATNFYVDTASNPGGNGTASNDVSTANRAFASLREALDSNSLDGSASNKYRVIWCKGVTNDINYCHQTNWDSVTTTPTTRLYIIGDNITGTNNPNTYKLSLTNNNVLYNNTPGHVWFINLVILNRCTTSAGNTYSCFRGATANVGAGRTDCDIRFINCGAVMSTNAGATDDIFGFIDSDFAVNDARNRCKRINCWAVGGTYGFNAADVGPFQVENYNCTAVTNEFNFDDIQLIVNCVGAFARNGVAPNDFQNNGAGNGFSGWNASADATATMKNSKINQTFTFSAWPNDVRTTSGDTGANGGLDDPLSGFFRFEVDGTTRTSPWKMGIGNN